MWIVVGLGYLAFFSWYTSFGGPLAPEDIAEAEAQGHVEAKQVLPFRVADKGALATVSPRDST